MDVQSDHGLLVVSLENCITSETPTCDLSKANSCIYTASVSGGICGHETSVVQLAAPVQCLSDIRQSFPRVQQHLTSLQPLHYSQAVSYETNQELQSTNLISNHTLYQPMNVSSTPIHYTTASPYLAPTLPILTPSVPLSERTEVAATTLPEPTYPAEGFDYFMEIQNYLLSEHYPPGVSKNYIKCLKKRSHNYLMVDGKLFLNRKQPKEVIMRKDQQEDMLTDIHVVKENGIHLGVKKMFNKLHMKYFWRGMYNDVVSFVRKCEKCSDQQVSLSAKEVRTSGQAGRECESDESEDIDDPASVCPDSPQGDFRAACRVWRKVEVQIHGPYKKTQNHNELILTMADPESRWCCAKSVPSAELPTSLAEFVFQSFCNYGFARCSIVSYAPELLNAVNEEYSAKVSRLGEAFASSTITHIAPQLCFCDWLQPLLDQLTQAHPTKWDKYLDQFLFQYRIGELKEMTGMSIESPFSLLFNHSPQSFTLPDEDKENIDHNSGNSSNYRLRQRRPHKRTIQCKQCQVSFTSKLSFRIHQRKHITESGHRKPALQQKKNGKQKIDVINQSTQLNIVPSEALRESTVTAVKALLEATKEERRRRGKYQKFSVELHEEMAIHAMQHGNAQAVRHFTEKLGTTVSESTIRNLVRIHNTFTPAMKSEIGRFASIYGVDSATKSFSEWLKRDISPNVVRKFKVMYLNKRSDCSKFQRDRSKIGKRNLKPCDDFRSRRYTSKIKDEIGQYACSHTVQETMEHFSKKLQMAVKERTVKRFYKAYVDKFIAQNNEKVDENVQVEPLNVVNQANEANVFTNYHQVQSLPVTLYQVNQLSTSNSTVCYQTSASSSLIASQGNGSLSYQTLQNFTTSLPSVPPPSYPVAILSSKTPTIQDQQSQSCLIPHHSLLLTQDRENPLISHFMATTTQPMQQTILTLLPEKETTNPEDTSSTVNKESLSESLISEGPSTNVHPTQLVSVESKEEDKFDSDSADSAENEALEPATKKKQRKKVEKSAKKRGSYTAYSPEIRAEIGKYAAEHGSIKACQHFAEILGHEVPESTARGLREKYLKKKKYCQVTSLGYSQRGRPLRLGKYDEVVQDCLRDLVRSGEKVSSFLAITTAKEIINKYEPSLLEENGGSLKLNVTWAKSFLKRIGVHNNS